MPSKSIAQRTKKAKREGTSLTIKATDRKKVSGKSAHALKKSGTVVGKAAPKGRGVSDKATPGVGKTRTSKRLPVAEGGRSTMNAREARPTAAAAAMRRGKPRTHSKVK